MGNYLDLDFLLKEKSIKVRSLFIAEKIDTKSLEKTKLISKVPMMMPTGARGCAFIFKYGSIILMNLTPSEEAAFIRTLTDFLTCPIENPKCEELSLEVKPEMQEQIQGEKIYISELKLEHLQLTAEVLARSVALDYEESKIARSFELIEPFAKSLSNSKYWIKTYHTKQLLKHIGTALLDQHNMVGRVEVLEKPELLWDNTQMERFYIRIMEEFDIKERHNILERKLNMIGSSAQTVLDIVLTRRNVRLEFYIVILIIIEIIISLRDFF